jgi:hypothetical protein
VHGGSKVRKYQGQAHSGQGVCRGVNEAVGGRARGVKPHAGMGACQAWEKMPVQFMSRACRRMGQPTALSTEGSRGRGEWPQTYLVRTQNRSRARPDWDPSQRR